MNGLIKLRTIGLSHNNHTVRVSVLFTMLFVSTLNNALKNISKPGLKKPALLFLKLTNWRVCCHWCCRLSLVG